MRNLKSNKEQLIKQLLKFSAATILLFTLSINVNAQQYHVAAVGFYNFENLFDTVRSVDVFDYDKFEKGELPYAKTVPKSKTDFFNSSGFLKPGQFKKYLQWQEENQDKTVNDFQFEYIEKGKRDLRREKKEIKRYKEEYLNREITKYKGMLLKAKNDLAFSNSKRYNGKAYREKLVNLSTVVSELATDITPDGVAILGIAEVEQRSVLEDFVKQEAIKDRNYQVIHHPSMDERGIDVALIYQPKYFTPIKHEVINLQYDSDNGKRLLTRDILWVEGLLNGDKIHVMVNHWPSRSGGELGSLDKRKAAAQKCKETMDAIRAKDPNAKIIVLGDFNDYPTSPSVKDVLNSVNEPEKMTKNTLYNPFLNKYKKGIGSNAWRDTWGLFDQILVSNGLLKKQKEGYHFHKAEVYNKSYLFQKTGLWRDYPYRGSNGGYSDHFPVLIYLVHRAR